jgi:thymidylate synthase
MKIYNDIHFAYLGTLEDVLSNPDHVSSPRGQTCREKLNYQFTITNPKVENILTFDKERNKVIDSYSDKEFDLYESGSNKVEDFAKASKFWNQLANPDGTVNSAYGYLIWKNQSHGSDFETQLIQTDPPKFPGDGSISRTESVRRTPWDWAKMSLRQDKDTRQSILRFSLPEHFWKGNKDFTCTLHGYFQIRDNKLSLTINMRSNDLMLGLVYDLPWFISLIYKMRDELLDVYPDLQIGSYTHYVHNIHIYDRDLDKINKMLGRA